MKHIPLTIALVSCLTSFSVTAESLTEVKETCLKGGVFQKAAAKGDIALVQSCVEAGTPVDSVEGNGWTSLHAAAFSGQGDVVKWLLKSGADRALKDKNGKTPLDLANSNKHQIMIDLLSDAKAKTLTTTDPKVLEIAEALRYELNNYGSTSSDDSIDRQIVKILHIQAVKSESASQAYSIRVKFKTGVFFEGSDEVTYEGLVLEDAQGRFTVSEYDVVDD